MSASRRAATVIAMYRGERTGLGRRAHDNCWEMGDGDKVFAVLARRIAEDPELARQVACGRVTGCGYPDPEFAGLEEPVYRYVPCGLLAIAADTLGKTPAELWPADTVAGIEAERAKAAQAEAAAPQQFALAL